MDDIYSIQWDVGSEQLFNSEHQLVAWTIHPNVINAAMSLS